MKEEPECPALGGDSGARPVESRMGHKAIFHLTVPSSSRNNLGKNFSINELKVAMALMLLHYELLPDPTRASTPEEVQEWHLFAPQEAPLTLVETTALRARCLLSYVPGSGSCLPHTLCSLPVHSSTFLSLLEPAFCLLAICPSLFLPFAAFFSACLSICPLLVCISKCPPNSPDHPSLPSPLPGYSCSVVCLCLSDFLIAAITN